LPGNLLTISCFVCPPEIKCLLLPPPPPNILFGSSLLLSFLTLFRLQRVLKDIKLYSSHVTSCSTAITLDRNRTLAKLWSVSCIAKGGVVSRNGWSVTYTQRLIWCSGVRKQIMG
jgi:hypothetical protein